MRIITIVALALVPMWVMADELPVPAQAATDKTVFGTSGSDGSSNALHSDTAESSAIAADDLSWWTVDGGGASSIGGSFILNSTIGQPDAGTSSAGAYTFRGGLWSGEQPGIFSDGFETGDVSRWSGSFE